MAGRSARDTDTTLTLCSRDSSCSANGIVYRGCTDFLRVSESRLFAAVGSNADAAVDAMRTFLDDPVLDGPRLVIDDLEVEIGIIDVTSHQASHRGIEHVHPYARWIEHLGLDDRKRIVIGNLDRFRLNHLKLSPMREHWKPLAQFCQPR